MPLNCMECWQLSCMPANTDASALVALQTMGHGAALTALHLRLPLR